MKKKKISDLVNKIHCKFFIKIVCLFLIFIIILLTIDRIFVLKTIKYSAVNGTVTDLPYLSEKWAGFYEKDKNTIDMLFMGTSCVHTGVDVNYLYHEYGFTSYNLSADQMSGASIYSFLKEATKYQSPKVIFIDVQGLFSESSGSSTSVHYHYDFMRQGLNRIQGIRENDNITHEENFFPFMKYHTRWSELREIDFKYLFMDKTNLLNGYFIYMYTNAASAPVQYEKSDDSLIDIGHTQTLNNLDRIIQFCDEKNIECILFKTPHVYTEVQSHYYDAVEQYAQQKGIKFWNFNKYYNEIGMDFSTDFTDGQHLNYIGSRKFTKFFGKMIAQQVEYEDHRGSSGYEEWETAYDYENYLIHAYEMRQYQNAIDYLDYNDYLLDDIVWVYTYNNVDDLYKIPIAELGDVTGGEGNSQITIMEMNNIRTNIYLAKGETWENKDILAKSKPLFIESLDSGTKVWFGDDSISTKEGGGKVDLIIYDKRLNKVLDHVTINTNNGLTMAHLL